MCKRNINPLVSIIIPVYKAEKYISTCIESVIAQTFGDWELILVDDGSPDRSGEICDEYAKKDERIIVIHKKNEGVSKARNVGLDIARAKYLSFIDSDDYVLSTYLSDMVQYETDLVVTGTIQKFDIKGKADIRRPIIDRDIFYSKNEGNIGLGLSELEMNYCWFGPVGKLYLREIIVNNNLRFIESIDYGEDHLFNMDFFEHVQSIAFLNRHNYVYMHRSGVTSLTNRYVPSEIMFEYIIRLYFQRERCLNDFQETLTRYSDFIRKEFIRYFWQTIWRLNQEKNKTFREKCNTVRHLFDTLPYSLLYNMSYKLPKAYSITRILYKIFPVKFATWILTILVK